MLSVYSVEYATPGPYKAWLRASRDLYRLNLSASTGDFTSGKSLDLFSGVATGFTVRITYKASYGQLTDLTTTLASIGVPDTLRDVLYNGTALRVMTGGEVARNAISAQGDPRRAAEVPAGAVANSVQGLARVRAQRIARAGPPGRPLPRLHDVLTWGSPARSPSRSSPARRRSPPKSPRRGTAPWRGTRT
jgi:hypothetical protein